MRIIAKFYECTNIYDNKNMKLKIMLVIFCFLLAFPINSAPNKLHLKLKENCKKIKCPTTQDLTCVNVTYNMGKKNMAYNVIVINKCEIRYINCHPGLKASIVPMRNCNHSSNKTKSSNRFKREMLKVGVRRSNEEVRKHRKSSYGDYLSDSSTDDIKPLSKTSLKYKKGKVKLITKKDKALYVDESNIENKDQDNTSDDGLSDYDMPQMTSKEALIELQHKSRENDMKVEHDGTNNEIQENLLSTQIKNKEKYKEFNHEDFKQQAPSMDETDHNNDEIIHMNSAENNLEYANAMNDTDHFDQTEESNVDFLANNNDCPRTCAAVNMMVCAHCQHGVYRTFMSVCHLRAFTCAHKEEKLSLVSRRPCMQSAPFLSNLPKYKGRLRDSTDTDRVLRFIRCRAEGRLGKDSKCNFDH